MEMDKQEKLCGIVDAITFRREDSGFTVLDMEVDGDLVTVVGMMPEVYEVEELTVFGQRQTHPTFGEQFRADSFERKMPATAAAILRYLSGGAIKGIGAATATKIVEMFGDDTLGVIENEPERLAQIKGISLDKAEKIAEQYRAQFGLSEIMVFLSRYLVTANEALMIWRRWGSSAHDMVEANPYVLCAPELGIGFERIDAAAAQLERPADDFGRIAAGITHVLHHNLGNGHTCIPRDKLLAVSAAMLGQSYELTEEVLEELLDDNELIADELGEREFIFLPDQYYTETYCAGRILMLMQFPPEPIKGYMSQVEFNERLTGIKYEKIQLEAICAAMERGFLVLTGGPGTGKTTTLNAIIEILEAVGEKVAIAAPTGRAAKRITEITGREAKTIHRLLEVEWGIYDQPIFKRNEKNPLECDALIVDELSMTDTTLFEAMLRAVRPHCRLILVGDSDQLPSVGAGNVLGDIIASGKIPVVQLREVFRQAQSSAIVTNAHRIVSGTMPNLALRDSDFFFLECGDQNVVAHTIEDLYFRRLPNAYGYSPLTDIQVLCPGRKGTVGTRELNKRLQQRLNPPHRSKRELHQPGVTFREGDKVMQIKNNYDVMWRTSSGEEGQGMFNGDVGIIESIDGFGGQMTVRFDERVATYALDEAEQLEHAYAITVHKSQGSEFPAVIIPVCPGPPQLQYRSLLYTAVTRAKSLLILVGQRDIVEAMVCGQRKGKRYTALAHFLVEQYGSGE
ncbi:MAG: ATP-dependent RecD-like DNA helicase [Clostridia bacterium]|nr:ATP-dependent RecD-like DNA helicase [Clostridia bacterium]